MVIVRYGTIHDNDISIMSVLHDINWELISNELISFSIAIACMCSNYP